MNACGPGAFSRPGPTGRYGSLRGQWWAMRSGSDCKTCGRCNEESATYRIQMLSERPNPTLTARNKGIKKLSRTFASAPTRRAKATYAALKRRLECAASTVSMLPQENLNKKSRVLLPQLRLPSSAHVHSASPRAGTWAHRTAPSARSVPATHTNTFSRTRTNAAGKRSE